MPRTSNPYPAEFKGQFVTLAKAGRSVESIARAVEQWVAQTDGVDTGEPEKLACLDARNCSLRTIFMVVKPVFAILRP